MKKKELEELKTKSISDLKKKILDLEKNKVIANLELKMGKSKNVHEFNQKRKDIAQAKTILAQKLFAAQKEVKNASN
jgi:ribosomal protein L29